MKLCALLAVGLATHAFAQPLPFLLDGDSGYVVLPAKAIATNGTAVAVQWSVDGDTLLVLVANLEVNASALQRSILTGGAVMAPSHSLYAWDRKTRKTKLVFDGLGDQVKQYGAFGNVAYCLEEKKSGEEFIDRILIRSGANSRLKELTFARQYGEYVSLVAHPFTGQPFFYRGSVTESGSRINEFFPALSSGEIGPISRIPEEYRSTAETPVFLKPNATLAVPIRTGVNRVFRLLVQGNGDQWNLRREPLAIDELEFGIETRFFVTMADSKISGGVQDVVMYGKHQAPVADDNSIVAAIGGTRPALEPQNRHIAYIHGTSAMVGDILKVDRSILESQMQAAARSVALSNARQVGLAIMMYSTDNDDSAPPSGEKFQAAIDPYLKNREISALFVYTFKGRSLSGIENPASTELGHINFPGGRAVVYADGHAKLIFD